MSQAIYIRSGVCWVFHSAHVTRFEKGVMLISLLLVELFFLSGWAATSKMNYVLIVLVIIGTLSGAAFRTMF